MECGGHETNSARDTFYYFHSHDTTMWRCIGCITMWCCDVELMFASTLEWHKKCAVKECDKHFCRHFLNIRENRKCPDSYFALSDTIFQQKCNSVWSNLPEVSSLAWSNSRRTFSSRHTLNSEQKIDTSTSSFNVLRINYMLFI